MRWAFVAIALFVTACEETVVLGSECPSRDGTCPKKQVPPGEDGDGGPVGENETDGGDELSHPSMDAGANGPNGTDAGRRDAGGHLVRDATVVPNRDARVPEDAGPALFPPFRNPSFELVDGGQEGALAETIPGATPVETSIAPWYTCRTGTSVNSSATADDLGLSQVTVTPTNGKTFLTDTVPFVFMNVNGPIQELAEPLLPDQHYAFAVDLRAGRDPLLVQISGLVLEVVAADALGCLIGRRLTTSPTIEPDGDWQTVCMDFTTPPATLLEQRVHSLMFLINAPGDPVNLTVEMHIDNIHPDPVCHNPSN